MEITILEDYSFLEQLIKDGQLKKDDIFRNDGLCFADKDKNFIYVFHIFNNVIFATYGYAKYKNKKFLKFHNIISSLMFKFNLPILRVGANNDFKNHTKLYKIIDDVKIYQFKKERC